MLNRFAHALPGALLLAGICLLTGCGSLPTENPAYVVITDPVTEPVSVSEPSDTAAEETVPATELVTAAEETVPATEPTETEPSTATAEIVLTDADGAGKYYTFTYGGETFSAVYTPDHWTIYDSYRITDTDAITRICEVLREEHPIHGSDMVSWRTADDMAYEWMQHNLAYQILPDDSAWKEHAKDFDIDPADQGKRMYDIYRERTGE